MNFSIADYIIHSIVLHEIPMNLLNMHVFLNPINLVLFFVERWNEQPRGLKSAIFKQNYAVDKNPEHYGGH